MSVQLQFNHHACTVPPGLAMYITPSYTIGAGC